MARLAGSAGEKWRLEIDSQSELSAASGLRRSDYPKRGGANRVSRQAEVRMIENIKELRSQFRSPVLPNRKALREGPIDVHPSRSCHDAAPRRAEPKWRGVGERGRVEPPGQRALARRQFGISDQVGANAARWKRIGLVRKS